MMELKRVAYGVIMAATLIFVRFIDIHVYNMPTFLSIIVLILIMVVSYKLVNRSSFFDRIISRNTYYVMNTLIISLLLLAFYTIET
jgi:ABC-type dipeptide/oligopeptide/nickel transport system permease component